MTDDIQALTQIFDDMIERFERIATNETVLHAIKSRARVNLTHGQLARFLYLEADELKRAREVFNRIVEGGVSLPPQHLAGLVEAVEFYGRPSNHLRSHWPFDNSAVMRDGGSKARTALTAWQAHQRDSDEGLKNGD